MALVSYDYDSASEDEDDGDTAIPNKESPIISNSHRGNDSATTLINLDAEASGSIVQSSDNTESDSPSPLTKPVSRDISTDNNLFSNLPHTKITVTDTVEDRIEDFIPKATPVAKNKQKVKISIPSLSEFNDVEDDEPQIKKIKVSNKSSGLISILPPVRGSVTTVKSFVPNVVHQKKGSDSDSSTTVKKNNTLVPNVIRKKAEAKQAELLRKMQQKKREGSDIESDDDIDMPETFDDEMWQKVCGRPKTKPIIQKPEEPPLEEIIDIAPEPEKPYEGLDNVAFKELVGRSKRPIGNIKLIDINEEEILPEKDLWMTKSLTDPEMAPKAQIEDPVDPTKRRKHHITYLAQQAKENEQELQNAWAASKNSRLASRAKYGF
ncbi:hypothetical protein NQ315_015559 [Exocentrus adspersus]|uniref:Proline-rich protein PRCC n=1 Tax=Exocentrus adspersus TaxID=1586481 RepID=A0AAV8V9H3_9CUCU|nr:hypothetical protein NQ315_015559 [Exocentrus adspersus]